MSVDESLVIASRGTLDDVFDQIHSAWEMHHLSTSTSSSENDEDECRSLQLTNGQFDLATETVAIRTRCFNLDRTYHDEQSINTINTMDSMEVDNESIENINELPLTIPFVMGPQITEPLTSDEEQTCVSWPSESQQMTCSSNEKQLLPSDAEEETMDVLAGSDLMETVSEPMPKKRKSFLLALGRMLLNVGKIFVVAAAVVTVNDGLQTRRRNKDDSDNTVETFLRTRYSGICM